MHMAKKALLLGSSYSAVPLLFILKRHGLHVSVCGNLPADPCHNYADQSFYEDYSKHDLVEELQKEHNFDYVIPSCNDYSYLSGAHVAEKYGLPGYDSLPTAMLLHNKALFRSRIEQIGLPAPKYRTLAPDEDLKISDMHFPLLVKPVDSFSGRGITKVHSLEELREAVGHASTVSRSGGIFVAEEFIEGSLHSHSAFISDRTILFDFFADEFCTVYPYQVNCSNSPSRLDDHVKDGMRSLINRLAQSLGLVDGLFHTQFIVSGDEIFLIESMRRCPGDLFNRMIELSTSAEYLENYVGPFIGLPPSSSDVLPRRLIGRHTISVKEPTIYFGMRNRIPFESVDFVPLKESGSQFAPAPYDKAGIVFVEFEKIEQMGTVVQNFADYIEIVDRY